MTSEHDSNSPEELEAQRVPLERTVSLKFKEFRGFITEYSANLSLGGMFIRSDSPQRPGTRFDFELGLEDDFTLIQGIGEVIWTRQRAAGPEKPAGMGIRFLHLQPESRELINKIVEEHVRSGGTPFDLEAGRRGTAAASTKAVDHVSREPPAVDPESKTVRLGARLLPRGRVTWAAEHSGTGAAPPDEGATRRSSEAGKEVTTADELPPLEVQGEPLSGRGPGSEEELPSVDVLELVEGEEPAQARGADEHRPGFEGFAGHEPYPWERKTPSGPRAAAPTREEHLPAGFDEVARAFGDAEGELSGHPVSQESSLPAEPTATLPPARPPTPPPLTGGLTGASDSDRLPSVRPTPPLEPDGRSLPPPPAGMMPWGDDDHDDQQSPEGQLDYGSPMKRPSRARPALWALAVIVVAAGAAAYFLVPFEQAAAWLSGREAPSPGAPVAPRPEAPSERTPPGSGTIFERPSPEAGEATVAEGPEPSVRGEVAPQPPEVGRPTALPPPAPEPSVTERRLTRLEEVRWERQAGSTLVVLVADGGFREGTFSHFRLGGDSPREVVRIRGVQQPYTRGSLAVGTDEVVQVRTGYHPGNELHVVLDLTGPGVSLERTEAQGNRLLLHLSGG